MVTKSGVTSNRLPRQGETPMTDLSTVYKDCQFWKVRACQGKTTNNCWNVRCPDYNRIPDYSWIPTKELCDELAKRDGVKEYAFPPSCDRIEVRTFQYDGKGRILVINGQNKKQSNS